MAIGNSMDRLFLLWVLSHWRDVPVYAGFASEPKLFKIDTKKALTNSNFVFRARQSQKWPINPEDVPICLLPGAV
ncbi:hypothetical protein [Aquipseudomonas alcaligenes]|jgi:hypothetical protein|uniref:hypothetical protein n=1 Tax=Aquipseudomonas alcaligenes TaxID=43263 RepID=UPI0005BB8D84|nr:hypothetical protein [Pseudomonas alcaligenes]